MKPVFVALARFKSGERNENLIESGATFEDVGAQETFTFWDQGYVCIQFLRSKPMPEKVYTLQCIGSDDRGRACDEHYAKVPSFEALTAEAELFKIHWPNHLFLVALRAIRLGLQLCFNWLNKVHQPTCIHHRAREKLMRLLHQFLIGTDFEK